MAIKLYNIKKLFLTNFLLIVLYLLFGILAIQLSILPGYSSAVFPSAGIGFAFVLYMGNRLIPGVWGGSFLINIWIAYHNKIMLI